MGLSNNQKISLFQRIQKIFYFLKSKYQLLNLNKIIYLSLSKILILIYQSRLTIMRAKNYLLILPYIINSFNIHLEKSHTKPI
jgi:hypothetical protein